MVMERFAPPDAGSVDTRGDGVSSGVFYAFPHPSRRCRATFPKGILIRHGVAVPPSPKGKVMAFFPLFTAPRPSPILGPRQSPTKWVCWGEEEQGSGGRATKGRLNRSGLWDDEKVPPKGRKREKGLPVFLIRLALRAIHLPQRGRSWRFYNLNPLGPV